MGFPSIQDPPRDNITVLAAGNVTTQTDITPASTYILVSGAGVLDVRMESGVTAQITVTDGQTLVGRFNRFGGADTTVTAAWAFS